METKMAVAFANIFMADIKTEILCKSVIKQLIWKRYIDIFPLWDVSKPDIDKFITQANHTTLQKIYGWDLKYWSHISRHCCIHTQTFSKSIHSGCKNTLQANWNLSVHPFFLLLPPRCQKKDSLRLLRTNSSKTTFEENIYIFNPHLLARGYPKRLIEKHQIHRRRISAETKNEDPKDILPFVTHLKKVLLEKWHLIQNQPPLISFKRRKSFNDVLVRLKL